MSGSVIVMVVGDDGDCDDAIDGCNAAYFLLCEHPKFE